MSAANTSPKFLTTPEAAAILRVPVATLYAWRHRGIGPPSARVGRRVLYRPEDLHKYVDERMVEGGQVAVPTPAARPPAKAVPLDLDDFESLPDSVRAALCIEDCAREVLEVLRLNDHYRSVMLSKPPVPAEVAANLLATVRELSVMVERLGSDAEGVAVRASVDVGQVDR